MSLSRFSTFGDQNLSYCKCTIANQPFHQLYPTPVTEAPCLIHLLIIILIYPYSNGIQVKFHFILFFSSTPLRNSEFISSHQTFQINIHCTIHFSSYYTQRHLITTPNLFYFVHYLYQTSLLSQRTISPSCYYFAVPCPYSQY